MLNRITVFMISEKLMPLKVIPTLKVSPRRTTKAAFSYSFVWWRDEFCWRNQSIKTVASHLTSVVPEEISGEELFCLLYECISSHYYEMKVTLPEWLAFLFGSLVRSPSSKIASVSNKRHIFVSLVLKCWIYNCLQQTFHERSETKMRDVFWKYILLYVTIVQNENIFVDDKNFLRLGCSPLQHTPQLVGNEMK